MEISFDDKILVALFNAAIDNVAPGGYRISQLMPEGSTLLDAREAASRLQSQGYITMPQGMSAGPIVYITETGYKRAQSLLTNLSMQ